MPMQRFSLEVDATPLPEALSLGGRPFPALRRCIASDEAGAVAPWVEAKRAELEAELAEHGAILFRGFPLRTAADFDAFVLAFGYRNFPYQESLSNAVRVSITARVFTANEAPASAQIRFHHELAQTPVYPGKLFFFCEQPAAQGGATPLCRSDLLFEKLEVRAPRFARDCETKGLRYHNVMPAEDDPSSGQGRSWRSTFGAQSEREAEERMSALGYSWEWRGGGSLHTISPPLPAVIETASGRRSFFNQLVAASAWDAAAADDAQPPVTFGDDTPIAAADAALAAELAEECAFDLLWQRGDVALVDNLSVMHGRRSFEGRRRLLVSLVSV
jgi:alpha-ketoglutarate-dependent taurine dioxygenase